jgi:hypothetical protein
MIEIVSLHKSALMKFKHQQGEVSLLGPDETTVIIGDYLKEKHAFFAENQNVRIFSNNFANFLRL